MVFGFVHFDPVPIFPCKLNFFDKMFSEGLIFNDFSEIFVVSFFDGFQKVEINVVNSGVKVSAQIGLGGLEWKKVLQFAVVGC